MVGTDVTKMNDNMAAVLNALASFARRTDRSKSPFNVIQEE